MDDFGLFGPSDFREVYRSIRVFFVFFYKYKVVRSTMAGVELLLNPEERNVGKIAFI